MKSSISAYAESSARAAAPVPAQPCVSVPHGAGGGGQEDAPPRSGSTVLPRSTYVSERELVQS